jgi:hypothetical protein
VTPACAACVYFRNEPGFLEAGIGGLASLSSSHASVRSDDGLCLRHDRHVTAKSCCAAYDPAPIREG